MNWYWVRATRSSMLKSCTGCTKMRMPLTWSLSRVRRSTTTGSAASRWSLGTNCKVMRPVLRLVLVPSTPMNEVRLCTAGSRSNTSARACWRCAMASNEVDWVASVMTCKLPVSCKGKKPLGTHRYKATVLAKLKPNSAHTRPGLSSTRPRLRP